MEKIKVLLADDHKIVRDGLSALLNNIDDIEVRGEVENGQAVIGQLHNDPCDVVIMDINMPGVNGIDATQKIKEDFPDIKVIALSMFHEESYITKMLQAGAVGYLLKNTGRDEIIKAIRTVVGGESYFSEDVSTIMMSKFMSNKPNRIAHEFPQEIKLTKREVEILKLIGGEFTNKEIADQLFISQRTVDTHRRNLIQKLGVKNTAGLVKYAMIKGLLE